MSGQQFQPSQSPPPVTPPADAAPHYYYPNATAGKRFLNYLIDSITAYGIVMVYAVAIGYLSTMTSSVEILIEGPLSTVIIYGLFIGYYFLTELTMGCTLGKLLTNTRVVNLADGKASWGQILGRTAARFIPFEPFSFLGANASGWHDSLSKTKVIDTSRPPNVVMASETIMRPFNPDAGQPVKKA